MTSPGKNPNKLSSGLLAHNLSKRSAGIRGCSQDKLLSACHLAFLENQRDVFKLLRLIKNQPYRLGSRLSGRQPCLGLVELSSASKTGFAITLTER